MKIDEAAGTDEEIIEKLGEALTESTFRLRRLSCSFSYILFSLNSLFLMLFRGNDEREAAPEGAHPNCEVCRSSNVRSSIFIYTNAYLILFLLGRLR